MTVSLSTARAIRTHAKLLRVLGSPAEADAMNAETAAADAIRAQVFAALDVPADAPALDLTPDGAPETAAALRIRAAMGSLVGLAA